ncbi:TetR family transcriptional regulator [Kitasatospora indigofera]|uniref:TetR family transcriptional regulator n=1 Tax=Kitasatospora indigofera TaxID=67307 RepID=A0A919KJA6_9ACTN|nr:TetR family transcriptional regulator [Kitasatospora indigofera]GHH58776.1 TetR family transcriptional regulator [Kitasatospora indigofera]
MDRVQAASEQQSAVRQPAGRHEPARHDPPRPGPAGTPAADPGPGGRRAAAQRLQMRQDLATAAMELFAGQGYEETTVDQIAAAAGVARRTFFRYFRSKEEAIFPDHDDTLVRVADLLASADSEEHPLDVVCRGIKEVLRMYASMPSVSVARYQLIRQVPALREREIAVVARYERLFTRYLLGRFDTAAQIPPGWQRGGDDDSMLAEVSAAAVVAAHNHVLRRWLRAGGHGDVEAQLDHSFEVIRGTFWATEPSGVRRRGALVAPGASSDAASSLESAAASALSATPGGEVLITVARTDAPLDIVLDSIRAALAGPKAGQ